MRAVGLERRKRWKSDREAIEAFMGVVEDALRV